MLYFFKDFYYHRVTNLTIMLRVSSPQQMKNVPA